MQHQRKKQRAPYNPAHIWGSFQADIELFAVLQIGEHMDLYLFYYQQEPFIMHEKYFYLFTDGEWILAPEDFWETEKMHNFILEAAVSGPFLFVNRLSEIEYIESHRKKYERNIKNEGRNVIAWRIQLSWEETDDSFLTDFQKTYFQESEEVRKWIRHIPSLIAIHEETKYSERKEYPFEEHYSYENIEYREQDRCIVDYLLATGDVDAAFAIHESYMESLLRPKGEKRERKKTKQNSINI